MDDAARTLIEYKVLRVLARQEALARLVISSLPESQRQSARAEIEKLELEFFDAMLAQLADAKPDVASRIRRMRDE